MSNAMASHIGDNPQEQSSTNEKGKDIMIEDMEGATHLQDLPIRILSEEFKKGKDDIMIEDMEGATHLQDLPIRIPSEEFKKGKDDIMIEDMERAMHLQDSPIRILSEQLKNVKQLSSEACIFKVNERLRKSNPEAYTPLTISIGPYHHGKPELRKMERLKVLYTQSSLKRGGVGVEKCWKRLKELQGKAESYYGDEIEEKVCGDKFVKMLLLDGCFIVEFLFRSNLQVSANQQECNDDPIYKMICGMESNIVRDMLLLENQLPFFVLQELYEMIRDNGNPEFSVIVKIAFLKILPQINIFSLLDTAVKSELEIKHLLQVVHILCQPRPGSSWKQSQGGNGSSDIESQSLSNRRHRHRHWSTGFVCKFWEQPQESRYDAWIIRTASELQEAGVDFKKVNESSLFDIKFNHGLLEIPLFTLFDQTETFFRNLIAYEQHSWDVGFKYFTDYAIFMDDLINTEKDVNILRLKDIFLNGLGDDKEVTHLFNHLCLGVRTSGKANFYYTDMYKELNRHYKKSWNVRMAKLRRNYFHSPWAVISTFAAILLLSLAIIQTVVAVLDLHK